MNCKIEIEFSEIKEKIDIAQYSTVQPTSYSTELKNKLERFEQLLNKLETQNIPSLILTNQNFNYNQLKNLLTQNNDLIQLIKSANEKLISYHLDISPLEIIDPDVVYQLINKLILKFGDNKLLGWLAKSILNKTYIHFLIVR
ncbi:MAG: hypothetical protein IPG39_22130 [Bacteroidetes bacterium]|nr:hypothetical protein [Bacteroidota bacterium]